MNKPKISVIIPVYNTESYVRESVENISNQTLKEIEIIVINDGSSDGSLDILNEMSKKDNRIQVYSQKNQGLSRTRNAGMQYANGEYIYFMDSDDLLESQALELCYQKCESENLDFVFFDGEVFCDTSSINMSLFYQHTKGLEDIIYNGIEIFNLKIDRYQYTPSVCLNLIRHSFLSENSLSFYPNILHEDQLFTCLLHMYSRRVGLIHRTFFWRRVHADSIMTRNFAWRNIRSYFIVADELIAFKKKNNSEIKLSLDKYLNQMLNAAIWQAHVLSLKERIKLFCICITKYNKYIETRTLAVLMLKKNVNSYQQGGD